MHVVVWWEAVKWGSMWGGSSHMPVAEQVSMYLTQTYLKKQWRVVNNNYAIQTARWTIAMTS